MRMISGPQGPRVLLDGRPVLLLGSDNYLGLADHPRVREAAADAAMRYGAGAGASRLASGTMRIHRRLEERVRDFLAQDAALLFGSRYLANIGVVPALAGAGEMVACDAHSHPSLQDGCALSRAETSVYRHCDLDHLAWTLEQAEGRVSLIVTDAVFGTDGDIAPLEGIVELAHRHDARVMVDDSHGIGAVGPDGRGIAVAAGLGDEIDVLIGSLGKAFGAYGAFVCCDGRIARAIAGTARTMSDSTALPPPTVAAAMAALGLLRDDPRRIEKLHRNAGILRHALIGEGLAVLGSETPIVTVPIAGSHATAVAERLLEEGVFAQALTAPSSAAGSSRLRLTVMATHTKAELREAAVTVGAAIPDALRRARPIDVAPEAGRQAGTGVFDGLAEAA